MKMETDDIIVNIECPSVLNVQWWRKFVFQNFEYKFKEDDDCVYLEISYKLTKIYDREGEKSVAGVNYKFVLYDKDGIVVVSGYRHRRGKIKTGESIIQVLKICLDDIADSYRLVIMQY